MERLTLPENIGDKFVIANGEKRFLAQAVSRLDDISVETPLQAAERHLNAARSEVGLSPFDEDIVDVLTNLIEHLKNGG
jgi:hypothetical protein